MYLVVRQRVHVGECVLTFHVLLCALMSAVSRLSKLFAKSFLVTLPQQSDGANERQQDAKPQT